MLGHFLRNSLMILNDKVCSKTKIALVQTFQEKVLSHLIFQYIFFNTFFIRQLPNFSRAIFHVFSMCPCLVETFGYHFSFCSFSLKADFGSFLESDS